MPRVRVSRRIIDRINFLGSIIRGSPETKGIVLLYRTVIVLPTKETLALPALAIAVFRLSIGEDAVQVFIVNARPGSAARAGTVTSA